MIKIEVFPTSNLIVIILKINLAHFVFQSRAIGVLGADRIGDSNNIGDMLNVIKVAKATAVTATGRQYCKFLVLCENEEGKELYTLLMSNKIIMLLMEHDVTNLDDTVQVGNGLKAIAAEGLLEVDPQYEHSLMLVE